MQRQFMERAPFAMLLQQNAVAVLGKGVSGFKVGPMPDYTHYSSDPQGVNARLQMLASSFASIPLTLFGLTLVTFLIGRVMPIDPVIAIAGDHAPPDVIAAVREQLGLDKPLLVQFWIYLVNLVHGDLGRSVMTSHPVTEDIAQFFPATLELATTAIIIAIIVGVPLGVFAAARQGSRFDHVVRVVSLAGQSIPVFVLGLLCLLVFYVKLGIAPGTGQLDVAYEGLVPRVTGMLVVDSVIAGDWDSFWDALAHLAQPALVLGVFLDGLHHAHDACLHDRIAVRRIHHHRTGQGTVGCAHPLATRVRQYRGAAGDGAGAGLCRTAGRRRNY